MSTESISVTNFREYLKIRTDVPDPDYDAAVAFLSKLGKEVGLDVKVIEVCPKLPVLVLTLPGENADLKSIMLYSHMDVVPVYREHWKVDPFSGHKDEKGFIYGRGAQDMKSIGIQYIEAIRKLKISHPDGFLRTVHIVFGPDEEIGGTGMKNLIIHPEFAELNVGFSLDEGIASEDEIYRLFYGERNGWWLKVTCPGTPGHASKYFADSAAKKFQNVINKILSIREENQRKLENDPSLSTGDIISANLTKVEGGASGLSLNVIPAEFIAYFDIRLPPTVDFEAFESGLNDLLKECGSGIKLELLVKQYASAKSDTEGIFWKTVTSVLDQMGVKHKSEIFAAGTDSKHLRQAGYQAMGLSPMIFTPQLLHDHNECLHEDTFLTGLEIYKNIISALANVPEC